MGNLFKKAAVFADIHYGNKSNSQDFNDDCDRFIDWFTGRAGEAGAETCIFLGDWNHSRSTVNVRTLNHSARGIRALSESFERVYAIQGNHDLFYRERRDVDSIPHARWLDNVTVIDSITETGGCALVPWLVDEEWKRVKRVKKAKYIFGHFELPHFQMNEKTAKADDGLLNENDFKDAEYVFTGHFHGRQNRRNVWYVGSPFAHSYADAWDFDRGFMLLEWGGEPEFVNWEDGPVYITPTLSALEEGKEDLHDRVYCRAYLDRDITHEDAIRLKEELRGKYGVRDIALVPQRVEADEADLFDDGHRVESVDQIVMAQLDRIEGSESMDKERLKAIYADLAS